MKSYKKIPFRKHQISLPTDRLIKQQKGRRIADRIYLRIIQGLQQLNKKMKQSDRKNSKKISPFVTKLLSLLQYVYEKPQNTNNQACMNWAGEGTFYITDSDQFCNAVLRKYFKHTNFSSFIRQLNIYGFEKVRSEQNQHYYHHPSFIPANKKQLKLIKRKNRKSCHPSLASDASQREPKSADDSANLDGSLQELLEQNERIKLQNKDLKTKIHELQDHNRSQIQKISTLITTLKSKYKITHPDPCPDDPEQSPKKACQPRTGPASMQTMVSQLCTILEGIERNQIRKQIQIQNLPRSCRQEQNKCIFEEQAQFSDQSNCLNIDNMF